MVTKTAEADTPAPAETQAVPSELPDVTPEGAPVSDEAEPGEAAPVEGEWEDYAGWYGKVASKDERLKAVLDSHIETRDQDTFKRASEALEPMYREAVQRHEALRQAHEVAGQALRSFHGELRKRASEIGLDEQGLTELIQEANPQLSAAFEAIGKDAQARERQVGWNTGAWFSLRDNAVRWFTFLNKSKEKDEFEKRITAAMGDAHGRDPAEKISRDLMEAVLAIGEERGIRKQKALSQTAVGESVRLDKRIKQGGPDLSGGGTGAIGKSFRSLEAAEAAHVRGEITNAEIKTLRRTLRYAAER